LKTNEYLQKSTGTFKSFINEFRVARNVEKSKTKELLESTIEWIGKNENVEVDNFAEFLNIKGITHGKIMTSLASKILFLNDPWNFLPIDNLVKKAVGLKRNKYNLYELEVTKFKSTNLSEMNKCLESVEKHLKIIETPFQKKISNIKVIRQNRFLDKVLWTIGRKD
jgi:hypothetical protein